jgi:valyl-tRNA synthetase
MPVGEPDSTREGTTRAVLGTVLDALLKLLHPFIPFVTETLWTALTGGESLVIAPWPAASGRTAEPAAAAWVTDVQTLTTEVRRFRSDQGLAPSKKVPARLIGGDSSVADFAAALTRLTPAEDGFAATASIEAALAAGSVHVELDTSTAVDIPAEIARLEKDLAVAQKEIEDTGKKLNNESFVQKAQPAAVEKARARAAKAAADVERLTKRLDDLKGNS